MIVVSNTSPLGSLMDLGLERLLTEMYGEVLVPRAVYEEVKAHRAGWPDFIRVETVGDESAVKNLLRDLDRGEAEAVVLAQEKRADLLLMDERKGRRLAESRGLRVIGLLGVLVSARREGRVGALRPLLDRLEKESGFWMTAELRAEVLAAVGES